MKKTTVTEIVIVTDEVQIQYQGPAALQSFHWCCECSAAVEMLAPELAAAVAGVAPRVVYQLVEIGRLHFTETAMGLLLICARSLSDALQIDIKQSVPLLPGSEVNESGI